MGVIVNMHGLSSPSYITVVLILIENVSNCTLQHYEKLMLVLQYNILLENVSTMVVCDCVSIILELKHVLNVYRGVPALLPLPCTSLIRWRKEKAWEGQLWVHVAHDLCVEGVGRCTVLCDW